jgi:hypothetical protein
MTRLEHLERTRDEKLLAYWEAVTACALADAKYRQADTEIIKASADYLREKLAPRKIPT